MAVYRCLADLQGKTLERNDILYLKSIRYVVHPKFLMEPSASKNPEIYSSVIGNVLY